MYPKRKLLLSNNTSFVLILIAGLVFVSCATEGFQDQLESPNGAPTSTISPALTGGDAPEYVIHHASGEAESVEDMSGIQAVLPFEVVTPQFLPRDMYLKGVSVSLPPEHLSEVGKRRNTRVRLTYGNDASTAGFMLHESILEEGMGPLVLDGPGTKRVITIAGSRGQVLEDKKGQSLSLAWTGCGVQFIMDASTARELTEPEVVRIANSTSGC